MPEETPCGYITKSSDISKEAEDFLNSSEGSTTKCSTMFACAADLETKSAESKGLQDEIQSILERAAPEIKMEIFNQFSDANEVNSYIPQSNFDNDINQSRILAGLDYSFESSTSELVGDFDQASTLWLGSYGNQSPNGSVNRFRGKKDILEYILEVAKGLTFVKKALENANVSTEVTDTIAEITRLLSQLRVNYRTAKPCVEKVYKIGLELGSVVQSEFVQKLGDRKLQTAIANGDPAAIAEAESIAEEQREAGRDLTGNVIRADKAIYKEQCFLLSQLTPLIKLKRKNHRPRLAYRPAVSAVRGKSENDKAEQKTEPINSNAPILIYDEPFGFINRLTQAPYSRELFNLTTDKLSSLVPTIKLYKVQTDPGTGKDVGYIEIKFDTNPAVKSYAGEKSALDLFRNSKKRGVGVGLKDFNFTFHGSDPFAAKKAIQAKLSIFATSFGDLIQDRRGDYTALAQAFSKKAPLANYKFADLALKTGRTPEDLRTNMTTIQKDNLDKLNFRLKIVMGWAIPQNYLSTFTEQEKEAVNDSFININLTPTTHEFSFDEMGGVGFDINYLAYIEDYFNNSMFNIFSSKGIEGNRIGRKLFYEFLTNENCQADDISKAKEVDAQFIQAEKASSFAKIIMQLNNQKKILYYNLSYSQISTFLQTGRAPAGGIPNPTNDNRASTKKLRDAFRSAINNTETEDKSTIESLQVSLVSTSRDSNKISFFYISDLIDVIMNNIDKTLEGLTTEFSNKDTSSLNYYDKSPTGTNFSGVKQKLETFLSENVSTEVVNYDDGSKATITKKSSVAKEIEKLMKAKEQFKKLRIVLGPMEIKDPFNQSKMNFCSIGDLPISVNYFTEFLTEKVLGKDQAYYPITSFIKDITNELIRNFINNDSCFSFNTKQRVRFNSSVISGFNRTENTMGTDDITYFIEKNPTTYGVGNVFNLSNSLARRIKPVINVSGPSRLPIDVAQPDREINYYVFYAGRSYPVGKMQGNEEQDAKDGIFHYILGKDRGIVKNISLDRTDMTGLKELRFEQEGFDGLTQLREVYNANIDCLLNMHTFPGTYIYVDPRGFSPEMRKDENGNDFTQFGIGGYYMITRSEHSIGPGKADTKITAKWVADTGGGNEDANSKKPIIDDAEDKPKKCGSSKRADSLNKDSLLMMDDSVLDFWAKASYNNGFFVGD